MRQAVLMSTCVALIMIVAACRSGTSSTTHRPRQYEPPVPSLLGTALPPLEFDAETLARYESELKAARKRYDENPGDEMNIIWLGRRLAYLGRYREAIMIFSEGLALYPDSYRLLRHRGHRYISLRRLDLAEQDLLRAASLAEGVPDELEPDGLPNATNTPRSTTQSNIWYHYALSLYLQGRFDEAVDAWTRCLEFSRVNDDMLCAALYWLYHARMRSGRVGGIRPWLRAQVREDMDVIENHTYHRLLLFYAGIIEERDVIDTENASPLDLATSGYGVAAWYLEQGHEEEAVALMRRIIATKYWPAFGYIAAEADLARRR